MFIKANSWYINLEQVTYINVYTSYIEIGFLQNHVQLSSEDSAAFLEAFEVHQAKINPKDLSWTDTTHLRRNGGT